MSETTNEKHPMSLGKRWRTILQGCNLPELEKADWVSKWLVISRSCVLSMTLMSGLIGLLLALERGSINWLYGILSIVGILAAHISNNLINDWTDVKMGVDTEDYPRSQYSTHPILGGLTTGAGLLKGAGILLGIDALIMIFLAISIGWPVLVFAVAGLALSLLYTVVLKRFALGELTSLVVWGPLMTVGTAYVASGSFDLPMIIASLPYGLIVASVLVGKHMDKREADQNAGVRTIPVLVGHKGSSLLLKISSVLFFALIALVVIWKFTGPYIAVSILALTRLFKAWKTWSKPKPAEAPEGWTVWPLWYVGWAMYFNRQAGSFLILGLLLNLAVPAIIGLFS
ncbi:MAG: prenyltransferase [Spirochaetales bacterium]|nr:prenyltransferase [Spirochaetales bacterium]